MTAALTRMGVGLCALAAFTPSHAQRWQMQYQCDEVKTSLVIQDLQFPSASRGVAIGTIVEKLRQRANGETTTRDRNYIALVTSDSGAHWQTVPLYEKPTSLFFLNERLGWLVTEQGIWRTTESGRNWTKLSKLPALALRVYFSNEQTGWAVCLNKAVLATRDGGRHWTAVIARKPHEAGAYTWIAFTNLSSTASSRV